MPDSIAAPDKKELRRAARALRAAIPPEQHKEWSEQCCRNLARWLGMQAQGSFTLATYQPIKGELDIRGLRAYLPPHCIVALPVTEGSQLSFHAHDMHGPLRNSDYGIDIPVTERPVIPDIIIAPLLAFDRTGNRLGYGGGFYDRSNRTVADAQSVADSYRRSFRLPGSARPPLRAA